ncbi:MAG: hypothetical protein AB7R89_17955 [Dehalococcoidia bacterium]
MTNEDHAQHRPPFGQDPAKAEPPMKFGQFYPEKDIIAVVSDQAAGERALQALQRIGVPEGDMDVIDPAWFLDAELAANARRNVVQRLAALVASEEGSYASEYVEEARQGHSIVAVHAADRARAEAIGAVLKEHGGSRMRYYDRGTIEDL